MISKKFTMFVFVLIASVIAAACGKSDADIQKAVQAKLTADNVTGVTASVKDGVATLTGEVADITVKNKADASVKSVEGVKSVTNNLTLRPLPQATASTNDAALQGIIEENWKKAGCTGATIEVKDGVATLSGTVPDAKFAECVMIAQEAKPKQVVNSLKRGGK
jgi:osmotically-inducible protein OsmY